MIRVTSTVLRSGCFFPSEHPKHVLFRLQCSATYGQNRITIPQNCAFYDSNKVMIMALLIFFETQYNHDCTNIGGDFQGNKNKIKRSFRKISKGSSLMTQYLPGEWLRNFCAENIFWDENGVHLFPWKQTLSPSLHRILSKENLEIRPRLYLMEFSNTWYY